MNVQSVCHLFEILFHVLKMLEEENHLDYCYCNEKKPSVGYVNLVNT